VPISIVVMPKFFIPRENIDENKIKITGDDVQHISKVLRLNIGDKVEACDGMGNNYLAEISEVGKSEIFCGIISKTKSDTEPPIRVILIQGVPKASKMDYIIQKTTELGICEIYPCDLKRCVAKIDNIKKIERWQKIAKEAAQQSGRGIIPKVNELINLKTAIEILKNSDISFTCYECAQKNTLKKALSTVKEPKTVAFLIGPEGGFDQSEIEEIENAGIAVITLGKRILRTETAGEAVLSMVMYEIGDIN